MRLSLNGCLGVFLLVLLCSCGGGGGGDATAPAAPANLVAIASDGQVALSWNASTGATTYHLKRAASSGGAYTEIAAPANTHYTDAGLSNGTAYYYVVTAANTTGESANSSEVSATPSTDLPVLPSEDSSKNHLGLNAWFLTDWDGGFAFVDAIKHARPWQDANDWHNPVGGIDALGWPTADASTVVITGTPAQVNGTYKLIFKGQADVTLMWAAGSVSNKVYDAASNTTTADVTYNVSASGSYGLIFKNTQRTAASATNTGFTEVHLYRPGYPADGSVVFTTPFLNALAKTSVVRMMEWTYTNTNLVQHWSQRMTPLHMYKAGPAYTGPSGGVWSASYTGVALEHQIQLCNTLHSDCWINIPVLADDDFVQKMALALRYGTDGANPYSSHQAHPVYPPLDPSLHLYLEYANEIWNSASGFLSFGVIKDIVESLPANHELLTPAASNVWYAMWRYPAYRMAGISDIFRTVYGNASMMNRVRPVLMTQQGNGQATLSEALTWLDAYAHRQAPAREVSSYLYGAGGSGYYSLTIAPADRGNADLFFSNGNYPEPNMVKGVGLDAVWAANYGLKRIAYEGGPGLDYYTQTEANAINLDPRMQDMIVKTHDAWSAQGGDLLVYYAVRGPREWEFTPDLANLATPKLKGLDQLNTQTRAAVTLGQLLPGSLIATDWNNYRIRTGYDYATTCDSLPCVGGNEAGEWIALPAHANSAFSGNLVVSAVSYTGATIKVWVNGVSQGQVTLPVGSALENSSSLSVNIPAGLSSIRLEVVSGSFNLRSITVN